MVKQRTIDEILGVLSPTQNETVQNPRALIKGVVPETLEIVRQGKIAYKLETKDFVWINHYHDHVDLEFAMGASLDSNLLRSRGIAELNPNIRHIAIGNFEKLRPELSKLVSEAAKLGLGHCSTK